MYNTSRCYQVMELMTDSHISSLPIILQALMLWVLLHFIFLCFADTVHSRKGGQEWEGSKKRMETQLKPLHLHSRSKIVLNYSYFHTSNSYTSALWLEHNMWGNQRLTEASKHALLQALAPSKFTRRIPYLTTLSCQGENALGCLSFAKCLLPFTCFIMKP